ncbi:MAG: PQQ-binding-like beta-propeller repeat protein, partial [Actinomycetota bacterium]|nr:PQQ-binding-like beta-propeller repeat protein [Actinomycetota bacterium]
GKVRSAPAAGNGMVYFARDDGKIAAVSARSGAEGWQFDADEPVLSSPTLAGGTLYAASAAGKVYALDATSGDEQWAFEAEPLCSAVAVGNGAAYVGTNAGTVYAIDAASGEQRWTFATSGRVSSAPAVEGTTVYFGSLDRFLYAVSGTGQLLWKFALGGEMATSPVVGNGLVYAATRDGYLYSLDAASGQFRSSFSTGAPIESLTVSGQTAYVGSGGENLRALAVTAPQTRWQRAIPGGSSPPRVHNCVVYAGSAQRDVYALDAANGNELWRYPTQAGVGGMSVVDGSLYVATLDGFLHKLTPPEPAPPPPVC